MSITNSLAPAKYKAGYTLEDGKGQGSTGPYNPKKELIKNNDDILRKMGLDPEQYMIVGKIHQWTKDQPDGTTLKSIFAGFQTRTEENTATEQLLASQITPIPAIQPAEGYHQPYIYCISDCQLGKADRKGGTDEFLARYYNILSQAAAECEREQPETLIIADVGDPIENIFNYANQSDHLDLGLDQQLALWQRILTQTIQTLAPYAKHTIILAVPSNHGQVRNSMGNQMSNHDFGISSLHAVENAYKLLGTDLSLEFKYPNTEWDDYVAITVNKANLLFTHGHNAKRQDKIPDWLAGLSATENSDWAKANIVITGHFHNRRYLTSRGRDIIECPTLESSSDWLYKISGEWSTPGLATFRINNGKLSTLKFIDED